MKRIAFLLFLLLSGVSASTQSAHFEWATMAGGSGGDQALSIIVDPQGNSYTTGSFQYTVDFDPGPDSFNLTAHASGIDIFVQKLDAQGNFVWARAIGGLGSDAGNGIAMDGSGNLYLTGYFNQTVDFDPDSASVFELDSEGEYDIFILKLNNDGEFIWAKSIGGHDFEKGNAITLDPNNNICVAGRYQSGVDFNPSGSGGWMTTDGYGAYDLFVLKLDNNGEFLWVNNAIDAVGNDCNALTTDALGNIYACGKYGGPIIFDPGGASVHLVPNGDDDAFVMKLDAAGNLLWVKSMGGGGADNAWDLVFSEGHVYTTGTFAGTVDFDTGPGTSFLTAAGSFDAFILKLDVDGEFVWGKSITGTGHNYGRDILTDAFGGLYVSGAYSQTADFDPSPATHNLTGLGTGHNLFVEKLDTAGNFIWVSSVDELAYGLALDPLGNVYTTGSFNGGTVDFDPGPDVFDLIAPLYFNNTYVLKLSQDSCINLLLSYDSISTEISCEGDSAYVFAKALGGMPPYVYSWGTGSNDSFEIFSTGGLYALSVTDNENCTSTASFLVTSPPYVNGFDLDAHLFVNEFRPGFSTVVWLDAFNLGCTANSGQVILTIDDLITYTNAFPAPDQIIGDSLIWNFSDLHYDSAGVQPLVHFNTNLSAAIGDSVCFELTILPDLGDEQPANNQKQYCFPVINGYDPNDKQVYPQGVCPEHYTLHDQRLTYKIRFQNTGNADAINIHIIDTISPFLDLTTANIISRSHDMYTEVLPGNVLRFNFDNIHLPDSTSNEPESHGFVIFEISPLPGLADGTAIENTSEIYFDFNPAVVTNTVRNTMVSVIPECGVAVKEQEGIKPEVRLFPNPTNGLLTLDLGQFYARADIYVFNSGGQPVINTSLQNQQIHQLDWSMLPQGFYFIHIKTGQETFNIKLFKE